MRKKKGRAVKSLSAAQHCMAAKPSQGAAGAPEHPASIALSWLERLGLSPCPVLAAATHHCRGLTHLQLHGFRITDSFTTISLSSCHHGVILGPPKRERSSVGKIRPESLSIPSPCLCRSTTQTAERSCPHGDGLGRGDSSESQPER